MRFLLVVLGLVVALLGCVVMAKGNDSSFLRGSPLLYCRGRNVCGWWCRNRRSCGIEQQTRVRQPCQEQ